MLSWGLRPGGSPVRCLASIRYVLLLHGMGKISLVPMVTFMSFYLHVFLYQLEIFRLSALNLNKIYLPHGKKRDMLPAGSELVELIERSQQDVVGGP